MTLFDAAELTLKNGPDWTSEARMTNDYGGMVAGVDEVGRGPLAGPVVAAAVILDPDAIPEGLNDSKKLTARRREALYDSIMEMALSVGVGEASVEEIDAINILEASMLAMRRAVDALKLMPASLLVDGNRSPGHDLPDLCLVKGDGRSFSIAAASIVAKITRDRFMAEMAKIYPHYGWEKNAGYGVPAHMEGLKLVGISPLHRKSFAPVSKILNEDSVATS